MRTPFRDTVSRPGQDDPPRPENENIKIVEAPRSVAYVASFGGFGVESNILSNAKELRAKLSAAGVSFDVRPPTAPCRPAAMRAP
jgi:hypothetical protein